MIEERRKRRQAILEKYKKESEGQQQNASSTGALETDRKEEGAEPVPSLESRDGRYTF